MNPRIVGLIGVVALAFGALVGYGLFGGPAQAQTVGATDLVIGTAYQVADFQTCAAPDGSLRKEWHFGGADRSRRNQMTPERDGRGRRIFRVVKNDSSLPAGHMRLRKVTEADPVLEGFAYGTYAWEGIVVEYNGRVEGQRAVGPCGPAR